MLLRSHKRPGKAVNSTCNAVYPFAGLDLGLIFNYVSLLTKEKRSLQIGHRNQTYIHSQEYSQKKCPTWDCPNRNPTVIVIHYLTSKMGLHYGPIHTAAQKIWFLCAWPLPHNVPICILSFVRGRVLESRSCAETSLGKYNVFFIYLRSL